MSEIYVYFIALSDPIADADRWKALAEQITGPNVVAEFSPFLEEQRSPQEKAEEFNSIMRSQRYNWIIDLSGGDQANLVLPFIDYSVYKKSSAYFCAFSDGTCIVNALAQCGQKKALLFPFWGRSEFRTCQHLLKTGGMKADVQMIDEESGYFPRHSRIVGGNLRCFLKLAGTGRMPMGRHAYVLLESHSGNWNRIAAMCAHLIQTGVLEGCGGVIFGRFSELERAFDSLDDMYTALKTLFVLLTGRRDHYFKAPGLGHIENSQGVWITVEEPKRLEMKAEPLSEVQETVEETTEVAVAAQS